MLAVDTFIATAVSLGSSCGGGGTDSLKNNFYVAFYHKTEENMLVGKSC